MILTNRLGTMSDDDKKKFELEKKAFMILTQALHRDIYHQFAYCTLLKACGICSRYGVKETLNQGRSSKSC
uniref:Uncharacterized protein n=1 Tax=Helianthus annuus TaxID=4232 RepID=A0A251UP31_HELAN